MLAVSLFAVLTACSPSSDRTSAPAAGSAPGSSPTTTSTSTSTTSTSTTSTSGAPTTIPSSPALDDPAPWIGVDAALRDRLAAAGRRGGALVVVRGDVTIHDASVGGVTRSTPMPVASAAKWMTAAMLMTFVDEGAIALDEPIARWLPEFPGTITLRQLLNHTSGLREHPCIWATGDTMSSCATQVARIPTQFAPGSAFSYGNSSFHVAGRLAEILSGQAFEALFTDRIGGPLSLTSTGFGGGRNPSPAAGLSTSADDYLRFMRMILDDGVVAGRRMLSPGSVAEIQRNQTSRYDTSQDYAVGITRIPTYGFGLWRDRVDAADNALIVSGNGGRGFYPWIDHGTGTLGVLAVDDQRGAEVAVPASHAVIDLAIAATPS